MLLPRGGNKIDRSFLWYGKLFGDVCDKKKTEMESFQGLSDRCFQEGAQVTSVLYAYIDFCVGFTNTTIQKKKKKEIYFRTGDFQQSQNLYAPCLIFHSYQF